MSWLTQGTSTPEKVDVAIPPEQGDAAEKRLKQLMDSGLSSEHALNILALETKGAMRSTTPSPAPAATPISLKWAGSPVQTEEASPQAETGFSLGGEDVANVARAIPAGIIKGGETILRAIDAPTVVETGKSGWLGPHIATLEEAARKVGPTKPGIVSGGFLQAGQSITTSIPLGVTGALVGGGVPGAFIGAISGSGLAFGAAEVQQFLTALREVSILNGATEEELAEIHNSNLWRAFGSGTAEMVGEILPNVIFGRVFGLIGSKTLSTPVKQGIIKWFTDYAKKLPPTAIPEGAGENMTAYIQEQLYAGAGMKNEYDFWETTGTTAVSSVIYALLGKLGGDYRARKDRAQIIADTVKLTGETPERVEQIMSTVEQASAGYSSEKTKEGLETFRVLREETQEWKGLHAALAKEKAPKIKDKKISAVPEKDLREALEKMGEVYNAEDVRVDEGQPLEGGAIVEGGKDEGGKDVQQTKTRKQRVAKVKQPALNKEEVVVTGAPTETTIETPTSVQNLEEGAVVSTAAAQPAIERIEPADRATTMLDKKLSIVDGAKKLIAGNARTRKSIYRKMRDLVDSGKYTPDAIAEAMVNQMDTAAYEQAVAENPNDEEKQHARIIQLKDYQTKLGREIDDRLGSKSTAAAETFKTEPTMQDTGLPVSFDTLKEQMKKSPDTRSLLDAIYLALKGGEQPKTLAKKYAEQFDDNEDYARRFMEHLGVQRGYLTPSAVLLGRQIEAEMEEGLLYERLVDLGISDEKIEQYLQLRRGPSQAEGDTGITEEGKQLLSEIENAFVQEAAEELKKSRTKREARLDKLKEKRSKVIKDKELRKSRTIERHEAYLTEDDAVRLYDQYRPLASKDADPETTLTLFKAVVNKAYHANEDITLYGEQLVQLTKRIEGDTDMAPLAKQEYLKGLGQLADLVRTMHIYKPNLMPSMSDAEQDAGWNRWYDALEARLLDGVYVNEIYDIIRKYPKYAQLFNLLDKSGKLKGLANVNIVVANDLGDTALGMYYPDMNRIDVNLRLAREVYHDAVQTIFHEVVHALTVNEYRQNPEFSRRINRLLSEAREAILTPTQLRFMRSNSFMAPHIMLEEAQKQGVITEGERTKFYSMTSGEEFIANSLARPDIQDLLSDIPHPYEKSKSLLDKIIDFIKTYIFQLKEADSMYTALIDEVVRFAKVHPPHFGGPMQPDMSPVADIAGIAQRWRDRQHRTARTIYAEESAPFRGSGEHAGISTGQITIRPKAPDPNLLVTLFMTPYRTATKYSKEAADIIARVIHGKDVERYNAAQGVLEIQRIEEGLSEAEKIELTSDMKEIEMGEFPRMKDKIKEKAQQLQEFFSSYRERMRGHLRFMLIDSMNATEQKIMNDFYVQGRDPIAATKQRNKEARAFNKAAKAQGLDDRKSVTSYKVIESYMKQLDDMDSWGIKDYITHAMKGSIAIVNQRGEVVSVAQTTQQAIDRAVAAVKNDPSIGELTIRYDHWFEREASLKLSKKQYTYVRGRIAKEINKEVKAIQEGVNLHIATKALGKVVAIKPGLVYTQFMQEREDILPGEENIFDILPTYVYQMEKKMALDPVIQHYINKVQHTLTSQPNLKRMVEKDLDAAKGTYWLEDRVVDSVFQSLGITEIPFTASRVSAKITSIEANLKFGYRAAAGMLNRMSGFGHTWVKTGLPYILQAKKFLRTEEGQLFMHDHAADLGTALVEESTGKIRLRTAKYAPTYFFQMAEKPNREESYVASYLFAKDKLGYDAENAREFARKSVWLQQFNYNIAAVPEAFRSPGGRIMFQFKNYLVNEMHFIASLKGPQEWAKYLTMQFVLGGPRGFLLTLKSFPLIGAIAGAFTFMRGGEDWFEELEKWANTRIPRFYRGMWGFFGIDASMPAAFQFPEDFSDLCGVVVSDLITIYNGLFVPMAKGEKYLKYPALETGKRVIPIMRHWTDILQGFDLLPGFPGRDGEVWDSKGRFLHKMNTADFIKQFGGAMPLSHSIRQVSNRIETRMQEKERAQAASIIEAVVRSRKRFDPDVLTDKLIADLGAYAISADTIMQAIMMAEIDDGMRSILRARMPSKLRALEEMGDKNKALHDSGYRVYQFD